MQMSGLFAVSLLLEAGDVDDEALVGALTDGAALVADCDAEDEAAAVDLNQFAFSRDGHPDGRCSAVGHIDMGADGPLPFSQEGLDALQAGFLDERDHHRRGKDFHRPAADLVGCHLRGDDLLLQAMEPCGEGQPKLLPYKNGKQGRTGDLMDMEQLGLLRRYVSGALSKVTEEIHTGGVRPDPYIRGSVGSCTYCPYAGVCHLDLCKIEPRALHSTKSGDFWARLAQREANHG